MDARPPEGLDIYSLITAGIAGLILGVTLWLKSFFTGKHNASEEVHGKQVVLEHAELRDFGNLPAEMRAISEKMERVFRLVEDTEERIMANQDMIKEQGRILARLETELEVAKRLREENMRASLK